jgi:hypothetical protein
MAFSLHSRAEYQIFSQYGAIEIYRTGFRVHANTVRTNGTPAYTVGSGLAAGAIISC